MHPKQVRKAKALVWYWLNHHPAEIYTSPTELGTEDYGTIEDNLPYDMMVINARTGWIVGGSVVERLCKYHDPDRWYDLNRTITEWYDGLELGYKGVAITFFGKVKGKPISRWHAMYTGLPAPRWDDLVRRFISQGYL